MNPHGWERKVPNTEVTSGNWHVLIFTLINRDEPCLRKITENYKCKAGLKLVYLNEVLLAADVNRDLNQATCFADFKY